MDISYYKKYEPIFGAWKIVREIGEGSFGQVFEIERTDFGRTYKAALKAIAIPQNQSEIESVRDDGLDEASITTYYKSFVEELVDEFSIMSKLKGDSNVVSYEDHTVIQHEDGIGWDILIRMELLMPLTKYTRENTITRRDVIKLGCDICRALELCQKHNIIHRDIKPENIFVSENGNFKLGDFGVARTIEKTNSALSKKGTYTYMAPEVYKGEQYGSNIDIYSLGIVLYRLLNDNRAPFLPDYPAPITHSIKEEALIKRVSGLKMAPPKYAEGRLAEIVLKACAFNPQDRYSSPMQMREELEAIMYNQNEAPIIYPKGDDFPVPPDSSEGTGSDAAGTAVPIIQKADQIDQEKVPEPVSDDTEATTVLRQSRKKDDEDDGTVIVTDPKPIGAVGGVSSVGASKKTADKSVQKKGSHLPADKKANPNIRKRKNVLLICLLAAVALIAIVALAASMASKNKTPASAPTVTTKAAADISEIKLPKAMIMRTGDSAAIKATITPEDADAQNIQWSTDNEASVKVDNGSLNGVAEGKAIITAEAGQVKAQCTVFVIHDKTGNVAAQAVKVGGWFYTVDSGNLFYVGNKIYWIDNGVKAEPAQLATLDEMATKNLGKWSAKTVQAKPWAEYFSDTAKTKSVGQMAITVGPDNKKYVVIHKGASGTAPDAVTVTEYKEIKLTGTGTYKSSGTTKKSSVTLSRTYYDGKTTDGGFQLSAKAPSSVYWKSSNTGVATVSGGYVSIVGAGRAEIYAICGSDVATCVVYISQP